MKAVSLGRTHKEIEGRKRMLTELDQQRRMSSRGGKSGTCCVYFRMLATADYMILYIF